MRGLATALLATTPLAALLAVGGAAASDKVWIQVCRERDCRYILPFENSVTGDGARVTGVALKTCEKGWELVLRSNGELACASGLVEPR